MHNHVLVNILPRRTMMGMTKRLGVGELIRERRRVLGIRSQQDLADRVGVNRPHISKIESGKIALPQPELRRRLCEVLGISDKEILMAAGWIAEEGDAYLPRASASEERIRSILRTLPEDDLALLLDFAELL
ncbi:MAG: helix-turn-helix transcriptional regulator, partial [Thermomicrobiales bacterium]